MKPSSNEITTSAREPARPDLAGRSILPGAFVHRMGENADDEKNAAEFWRSKGLLVEVLEDANQPYSSLPDLRLSRYGRPWAYCEVKTIWKHTSTIRIHHEKQSVEERRKVIGKTIEERIAADLVTAIRQLKAGNPEHSLLNIVMLIINKDPEASHELVARLLVRQAQTSRHSLAARRQARINEELHVFRNEVDLCIWVNELDESGFSVEGYFLLNPQFGDRVREIRGLGFKKQIQLDPAA